MKYENYFLIYNVRSKRLSFQKRAIDDKTHLTAGRVEKGVVNGHPVDYWLGRIEQKKVEART